MATLQRELAARFEPEGYTNLDVVNDEIVGLRRFIFTSAIVVGIDAVGYRTRYCYGTMFEAKRALQDWKASGDEEPSGYIKRKG